VRVLFTIWLGFMPASALANNQVCTTEFVDSALLPLLDKAEEHLNKGAVEDARAFLSDAHQQLLCMKTLVSSEMISRMSRQFALAFFFDQDDDAALRWLRSAHSADPEGSWPASVEENHPLRSLNEEMDWTLGGPKNTGFLVEKKATLFINGQFAPVPVAPIETPLLFQMVSKKGEVEVVWWQDGAAFPNERLVENGAALAPPKWWTGPIKAPAVAVVTEVETVEVETVEVETVEVEDSTEESPPKQITIATYVDPFEDAKTRRVLRERSERTVTNASGSVSVVRTEIVSFIPDPSEGRPVTHQHFEQWLADSPEWHRAAAISRQEADENYLKGWDGLRHPDGARKKPMVWLPFTAAQAYCQSFENELAPASLRPLDALEWEWRVEGTSDNQKPTKVSSRGKAKSVSKTRESHANIGFRCKR